MCQENLFNNSPYDAFYNAEKIEITTPQGKKVVVFCRHDLNKVVKDLKSENEKLRKEMKDVYKTYIEKTNIMYSDLQKEYVKNARLVSIGSDLFKFISNVKFDRKNGNCQTYFQLYHKWVDATSIRSDKPYYYDSNCCSDKDSSSEKDCCSNKDCCNE